MQKLLIDVQARRIDVIVVYKVDRLTRSLADFAKLVETFDAHGVSFVSVTQSFNTTTSMGRLTLNVLLSFAQFEREVKRKPTLPRNDINGGSLLGPHINFFALDRQRLFGVELRQVLLPARDNPIGHVERLSDVYVLLGELGVTIGCCLFRSPVAPFNRLKRITQDLQHMVDKQPKQHRR